MDIMDHIKQAIESNPVILFMKGTPEFPQCGFSSRASQALAACGAEFASIDVLAEPEVRANLHRYILFLFLNQGYTVHQLYNKRQRHH